MRWDKKDTPTPGDTRRVKRFAWFPTEVLCKDKIIKIWLEEYYTDEIYDHYIGYYEGGLNKVIYYWRRTKTYIA
jgi:hypothetical protein